VLLDKAMMELSSLTASVTLLPQMLAVRPCKPDLAGYTYIKEFGFFFFFRMAVDVSVS